MKKSKRFFKNKMTAKQNDGQSDLPEKSALFELAELFIVFFKVGICTFGGGLAMLPFLERELAHKRKWTTEGQLLDYYAIGQSTPGIIAVNVATFVGYTRKKFLGALAATTGIVTPSVLIITVIALFLQNFQDVVWVQKALSGINVGVAALMTQVVWSFGKKCIKSIPGIVLCISAFAGVCFFHIHSVFVIIISAAVGICLTAIDNKRKLKNGGDK